VRPTAALALLCFLCLNGLLSCTAQIRDDEKIASDALILTAGASASSQPLGFKPWNEPAEENDLGVAAVRQLRLDEAEALFEQSISKRPLFALAYLNLARLYIISGEEERARAVYMRLAQQKSFSDSELFNAGRKLHEFSRTTEGIALLEALAQVRPSAPVLTWLGSYKLGLQQYAGADRAFDEALAINRIEAEALFGRGYIRFLSGDFEQAADFLGRARTAGSKEARLCVFRLQALFQSGRLEEAEKEVPGCKAPGADAAEIKARVLLVMHPLAKQMHPLTKEETLVLEGKLPGVQDSVPEPAAADLRLEY